MSAWPNPSRDALRAFYGNPDANADGTADPKWEAANLVRIPTPYRMVLAWDEDVVLKSIRCHQKVAPSLTRVLDAIARHYGTQEAIEKARMHLFGGAYSFRVIRGGSTLSLHSYGAAIDLDPANNPLGLRYDPSQRAGMMPRAVIELFEAEGWLWGGKWSRPDGQHFQATQPY